MQDPAKYTRAQMRRPRYKATYIWEDPTHHPGRNTTTMRLIYTAILTALWYTLSCSVVGTGTPTILQPHNNAIIAPGQRFAFEYQSICDYSVSSYHIHVWLLTRLPKFIGVMENFARGHYFGMYEVVNYPGELRVCSCIWFIYVNWIWVYSHSQY
ncbi:hypothetical protein HGRIS_004663 [Hohenbuehelia grisea]|uniref:Uncharacterized protein n=1 Tax=Hohenbuehelia grisea TaxID=104357 RepID=A0ABR3JCT1_9AGAR